MAAGARGHLGTHVALPVALDHNPAVEFVTDPHRSTMEPTVPAVVLIPSRASLCTVQVGSIVMENIPTSCA